MSFENLAKLASFVRQERDALLGEWRSEVRQLPVARDLDVPTLNDHLPDLLEELACELKGSCDETMIDGLRESSGIHGAGKSRLIAGSVKGRHSVSHCWTNAPATKLRIPGSTYFRSPR